MFKFPCDDQTASEVAAYYRNVKPGDLAVVRDTRFNNLSTP
jgi:hypothetical protein